jgi:hypothetical protein
MAELPHCDELYLRFFDRWLSDDDRERKGFKATRPDMLQDDGLKGLSEVELSPLKEEYREMVAGQIKTMLKAARGDMPQYLKVSGEVDLEWVDAFDQHFDEHHIQEFIDNSKPEEFSNDYIVSCGEFGAVLGQVMKSLQPRLIWRYDWPYFESALVDPISGNMIPVLHWAVKKMSGYGCSDGFSAKLQVCLQLLDQQE